MLIGIDAGGTKNELVLCEKDGRVVNRLTAPGSNAADLGPENAAMRIASQVRELTDGRCETVDALFAGLSGGGAPAISGEVRAVLTRELPFVKSISNGSDALNGLYAGVGAGDGMVVIAGTGTSAFVRCGGVLTQVGGWGYLVDDAGSGYSIGRAVLNAAFRERDGRGESTRLTELVERQLGFNVLGAVPMIYRGGKRTVASFAPLAFEAADMGDRQALAIVDNACRELRLLISTCASHLKNAPYLASLLGSLWKAPRLLEGVRDLLSPDYRLLRPDLPPVFGAAVAAAELARVSCGEAFHDRFAESYTTFTKKAEA
ncbi:MAG: BadF/BadG/BcrA/BcrD ATPase family protein [Clostridiales bacterium]|nr:BadF/BadG/BcrA/BcrD ATPase family protein [Clostridiales bacterium]